MSAWPARGLGAEEGKQEDFDGPGLAASARAGQDAGKAAWGEGGVSRSNNNTSNPRHAPPGLEEFKARQAGDYRMQAARLV